MIKSSFIIFCFVLSNHLCFSQNSFIRVFPSNRSITGSEVIVHNENYYIIANKNDRLLGSDTIINYSAVLYQLSSDNSQLDSLLWQDESRNFAFNELVILPNNHLALIGTIEKLDSIGFYNIFFLEIDEQLNIINEKYYDLNIENLDYIFSLTKSNGNISLAGIVYNGPPNHYDKIIMEFKQNGELVFDSIYDHSNHDYVYDFITIPNTPNYLLYCYPNFSGRKSELSEINILDANYNLIDTYYVDEDATVRSILPTIDSCFITSDRKIDHINGNTVWLPSLKKYNTMFEEQDEILFGSLDTISMPAMYNSLATNNYIDFYSACTFNIDIQTSFSEKMSYFALYSTSYNLEFKWQKFYGGDAHYRLQDIAIDTDDGCLLVGSKYENGSAGPYIKTLVLIKTDQNGLITSTEEESIPIKNAIVSPNPGRAYLNLHTGVFPAMLQVFDLHGHLVLEEEIHSETSRINTNTLSSGTYIWSLIKEGDLVETGKWVKE